MSGNHSVPQPSPFGLSVQSWRDWLADRVKAFVLGGGLGALAAVVLYALVRAAASWWWTWLAPLAAVLVVAITFVVPVLVEPLFLRFRALEAGSLRDAIAGLALRGDVPLRDILVADAIIVEVKAVAALLPAHDAQVLTYLRMSHIRVGLLMNFHATRLKDGLRRFIV